MSVIRTQKRCGLNRLPDGRHGVDQATADEHLIPAALPAAMSCRLRSRGARLIEFAGDPWSLKLV